MSSSRRVFIFMLLLIATWTKGGSADDDDEEYSDCQEIPKTSTETVHIIKSKSGKGNLKVRCNMELMDGGWTYILNRIDDSQDFNLDWECYKSGFGDFEGNFWIGLDYIHELTNDGSKLLVYLTDEKDETSYAQYEDFRVDSEEEGYKLKELSGYNGTAGDSLIYSLGMMFSTTDKDQDAYEQGDCANYYGNGPGWWYKTCTHCLLTGRYLTPGPQPPELYSQGIYWRDHGGIENSFKQVMMLIKPTTDKNK